MTLLALDSRWRRFNDPNRACPCCGRRFSGIFDIGFDAPDAWPHGERLGEDDLDIENDRLGPEFCRIGARYFLRAVLTLPLRGSEDWFSFGPWAEVPEPVFRAYLATIEHPDQPFGPAEGLLANALPLFEDEAESAVTLTLPDPSQRPRLTATDGPLAEAQAQGISFDDLLEIYAACGDDIRPHLAAD
ncbi:DUF2199 domain-containing protein [Mameliella sp. CS4]|uniref:DUF2199 domain-containing protein n=1 Tax=Mameliella sp. CS4 TaxID=2862329 RepID=UPI001C5E5BE5|nr:DUF2199 domain-containing protein [Mameliella sp. CS4]MBW4985470.1 DUF2199 domain-containing protein [Mameliella sp. CS4]